MGLILLIVSLIIFTRVISLLLYLLQFFKFYGEACGEETVSTKCLFKRSISEETFTDEKNNVYRRTISEVTFTYSKETKVKKRHEKNRKSETNADDAEERSTEVCKPVMNVVKYCKSLLKCQFAGQATTRLKTDVCKSERGSLHLGVYLRLVDSYLRLFETAEEFTGTEAYYLKLLRYIASKRKLPRETEEECYWRLLCDSKRFVQIYQKRGGHSQPITAHERYWGSRQQLLSGKVIADWADPEHGPIDAIFGVLLNPTAGRAGPGDDHYFHLFMFDDNGHVAYHSAAHDAFGYLLNSHGVGPGYDYMEDSYLVATCPLAGQLSGMAFWKNVLKSENLKPHIMDLTTRTLGILPVLNYQVKGNTVYL